MTVTPREKTMKRILVVDDSRVTREVMKVFLIARDVEVVEAADGAEALAKVRANPPSIVLADLGMPRLDGCGLCEAIRADPRTRDVPVVIITSSQDEESGRRAQAAGAREVLRKPVQPQQLMDALRRHMAVRAS